MTFRRMEPLAPLAATAYGVDDAGTGTVVIRARHQRGRLRLDPMTADAMPGKGNGVATACAMPPGQAMAVWLQAPLASRRRVRRVLPTLLDMAMPYPLDECVCAFAPPVPIRDGGSAPTTSPAPGHNGMMALAVAARRADITRRLADLERLGVSPQVLDHEGLALWTQAQREHPPTTGGDAPVRLVVHVRDHEAVLAMGVADTFWSAHRLTDGGHRALERTVRVQLDNAGGGRYATAPRTWIWSGTDPADWRTNAESALPGTSLSVVDPAAFLARALAIRALTRGPLQFNLREGAFEHPEAIRQMQRARHRRMAGMAVAALLLLAVNTAVMVFRSQAREDADARFTQRIAKVAGWPVPAKGENAILIARRELETRQTAFAPLARAFDPSLLETLETVLDAAAAEKADVNAMLLTFDRIRLRGDAPSPAAAESLQQRLKPLRYGTALKTAPLPDGRVSIVLEGGGQTGETR